MAQLQITASDAQAVKLWSKVLYKETLAYTHLFKNFLGDTEDAIFYNHNDLEKSAGDSIKYDILLDLIGPGVSGSNIAERNGEAMVFKQNSINIDQHRFPVGFDLMSQQRTIHQLRESAMTQLKKHWGKFYESMMFRYLGGDTSVNHAGNTGSAPDGYHYFMCGNNSNTGVIATDEANLGSDDQLVLEDLDYMREKALVNEGTNAMRPIRIKGKSYFVLVLHPYVFTDLRQNVGGSTKTTWMQIQQNANKRGLDNPALSGAEGEYNGIIIHQSPYVYSPSSNVYRNVLLGAQAGVFAMGNPYTKAGVSSKSKDKLVMKWSEESWDHGDKFEVLAGACFGIDKTKFSDRDGTTRDYGCMVASSYSAAHES